MKLSDEELENALRGARVLAQLEGNDAVIEGIEEVRRHIEALEAERVWQPIETAPKGDEDVLLYCADTGEQMVGFRIESGEYQFAAVRGPGHVHTKVVCQPTHWMPLPEPPKGDE